VKKLEDIPKKQIFEVPEGYFEKLPGIIQSRVVKPQLEKSWWFTYRYSLRFALPAVILVAAGIFWFYSSQTDVNVENILASIQTEDLITYLNEADLTTEELLEHVELDAEDVSTIEESVYEFQFSDSDLEEIFNEEIEQ
jgi:hypothetical protein